MIAITSQMAASKSNCLFLFVWLRLTHPRPGIEPGGANARRMAYIPKASVHTRHNFCSNRRREPIKKFQAQTKIYHRILAVFGTKLAFSQNQKIKNESERKKPRSEDKERKWKRIHLEPVSHNMFIIDLLYDKIISH